METLSRKESKARKEHYCDWCGDVIKIGEIYDSSFNVSDGDSYNWKNHKRCAKIAHKLNMFDECDDGVNEEDFQSSITEFFTELKEDSEGIVLRWNQLPVFIDRLDYVCNYFEIK